VTGWAILTPLLPAIQVPSTSSRRESFLAQSYYLMSATTSAKGQPESAASRLFAPGAARRTLLAEESSLRAGNPETGLLKHSSLEQDRLWDHLTRFGGKHRLTFRPRTPSATTCAVNPSTLRRMCRHWQPPPARELIESFLPVVVHGGEHGPDSIHPNQSASRESNQGERSVGMRANGSARAICTCT
jgi:hypothetical protein